MVDRRLVIYSEEGLKSITNKIINPQRFDNQFTNSPMSSFPVLLVEDKDSLRLMLRHALEGQGHTVVEARDEPEAIRRCATPGRLSC